MSARKSQEKGETSLPEFRVHRALRGRSHSLPRRDSNQKDDTRTVLRPTLCHCCRRQRDTFFAHPLSLSLSQTQARLLPRRIARGRESHPLLKRKSPRVPPPPPRSAKPHLIDFPPRCCRRRRSGWLAGCFPPSPLTSSFPFCRSSPRSTSASRFFLPFGRLLSLVLPLR